jgi:hypothetical protein
VSKFTPIFFDTNYFKMILSRQKLGIFLENKVLQKLNFSKNVSDEKCASIMTRFNDFF